ncbi:MAG: FAD-binding oxidoreductase [Bdellovibrionales bacterium]|nr:FAD-binding oxidoreductase [Bdellovibrionales bacterium]
MSEIGQSWGRYPQVNQEIHFYVGRSDTLQLPGSGTFLPYGQGRSYGDSCLNAGGTLISTRYLDKFISFDPHSGRLSCEAGVTLEEILNFFVPRGWFIPVSPGTQYVSVGGAIANDIHGKNHHRAGTFGCHVLSLELLRSNGERLNCSPDSESALFRATVGGLGLTGLIVTATLQLKPICSAMIDLESIKFKSLDEFFEVSKESERDFEYTVAWIDCLSSGDNFGRGIFMRGNHSISSQYHQQAERTFPLSVPLDLPSFCLNPLSVRAFNFAYYHKQREPVLKKPQHYKPFFYPLDAVQNWNRIYGRRGFLQFQCVVPSNSDNRAIRQILKAAVASGKASFLAVIKEFGEIKSPGILSFPRPGITLCMDFPFEGASTLGLFNQLDDLVLENGGALYPAKDACMRPAHFKNYYPRHQEFSEFIDPRFSSSFWRRVGQN